MLALDPGNHWFIFIRKERSSCSQKNLLGKMPKVLQATSNRKPIVSARGSPFEALVAAIGASTADQIECVL